jgi:hypothetical protein
MPLDAGDKQWISERLKQVETKLSTEFHKWASPAKVEGNLLLPY